MIQAASRSPQRQPGNQIVRSGLIDEIAPGLERETSLVQSFLKQAASELIESLNRTGLVDGLDVLCLALNENRTILRSISYIARSGSVNDFDREEIDRMSNVLQQFEGRNLRRSDAGNIVLEDASDIKDFIRLLGDYYKQGMVSRRFYGSHGGQVVTPRIP
ncbi:DUF4868 domain-containing protein [Cyanobium sp. FGCU-52]|nr:DUF4868 domain-containing protein [Cyanobium sp. FGCU52]